MHTDLPTTYMKQKKYTMENTEKNNIKNENEESVDEFISASKGIYITSLWVAIRKKVERLRIAFSEGKGITCCIYRIMSSTPSHLIASTVSHIKI